MCGAEDPELGGGVPAGPRSCEEGDCNGMRELEVEIVNRLGLHARAAAKLVHRASQFDSSVTLVRDGEEVDAKSILGILLLAAAQGTRLTVRTDGPDEDEALAGIAALIADRFEEAS